MTILVLLPLSLLSTMTMTVVNATDRLKQVQMVVRHGARTRLEKSSVDLSEGGGAVLTPLGERQLYDLGVKIRNDYNNEGVVDAYSPSLTRIESSSFDRTIVSANSFVMGLFPADRRADGNLLPVPRYNNVPIYTLDQRNDVYLRAYDKCPAFWERLTGLYESSVWKNREQNSRALLGKLAANPLFEEYASGGIVPLKDLWNAYDRINIVKTECQHNPASTTCLLDDAATAVTDVEWVKLQELVHYAETAKYGVDTAGSMLGGKLLEVITNRMGTVPLLETSPLDSFGGTTQQDSDQPLRRFYMYSAHYPTILGLLSAMGVGEWDRQAIPPYASALIFELWENETTREQSVKIRFADGNDVAVCNGSSTCSIDVFRQMVATSPIVQQDWCEMCQNDSADICLQHAMTTNEAAQTCTASIGVNVLVFIFGSLFGCCLVLFGHTMCKKRNVDHTPAEPEKEVDMANENVVC